MLNQNFAFSQPDDTSRISIYVRIARILRDRIQKGEWPVGQPLPTLSALCDEFNVSRNTVRQALQILVSNGLIHNARGRPSVVTATPVAPETNARIIQAINDPLIEAPLTSIEMIERYPVKEPPQALRGGGRLYPSYLRLKKLHRLETHPFALADFYVAETVAQTFPPGAEELFKVERLLREQRVVKLGQKRQSITVGHADAELARAFECEMAEVTVQVRRWWEDVEGGLVCASLSLYRADRFVFELVERFPGAASSTRRPSSNKQKKK